LVDTPFLVFGQCSECIEFQWQSDFRFISVAQPITQIEEKPKILIRVWQDPVPLCPFHPGEHLCWISKGFPYQSSQASSPSVFGPGRDGRQYLKAPPGRTGISASVRTTAQDGLVGTAGVSGGAIFGETPDDGWALQVTRGPLQVIGEACRRRVRTADGG